MTIENTEKILNLIEDLILGVQAIERRLDLQEQINKHQDNEILGLYDDKEKDFS